MDFVLKNDVFSFTGSLALYFNGAVSLDFHSDLLYSTPLLLDSARFDSIFPSLHSRRSAEGNAYPAGVARTCAWSTENE